MLNLTVVQPRKDFAQVAGWQDVCRSKFPNVFGTFEGPTFYQSSTLSGAIRNASGNERAIAPAEWP